MGPCFLCDKNLQHECTLALSNLPKSFHILPHTKMRSTMLLIVLLACSAALVTGATGHDYFSGSISARTCLCLHPGATAMHAMYH